MKRREILEACASQILRFGLDDEIEMPPHKAHIRRLADDQKRETSALMGRASLLFILRIERHNPQCVSLSKITTQWVRRNVQVRKYHFTQPGTWNNGKQNNTHYCCTSKGTWWKMFTNLTSHKSVNSKILVLKKKKKTSRASPGL